MRRRHVLILLLLAAIPIGLAIVLAGGGGTRTISGVPSASVSLALVGGTGGEAAACGATRHYTISPAGSAIRFRGTISKAGAWKVKVKLKACRAGAFQSAGEASATLRSKTSYTGSFPAPIAGYYVARAELEQGGVRIARSGKAYFEIR